MATVNSPFTKIDQGAEKRRALAKVYSLLLRLADETKSNSGNTSAVQQVPREETSVLEAKGEGDITLKEEVPKSASV